MKTLTYKISAGSTGAYLFYDELDMQPYGVEFDESNTYDEILDLTWCDEETPEYVKVTDGNLYFRKTLYLPSGRSEFTISLFFDGIGGNGKYFVDSVPEYFKCSNRVDSIAVVCPANTGYEDRTGEMRVEDKQFATSYFAFAVLQERDVLSINVGSYTVDDGDAVEVGSDFLQLTGDTLMSSTSPDSQLFTFNFDVSGGDGSCIVKEVKGYSYYGTLDMDGTMTKVGDVVYVKTRSHTSDGESVLYRKCIGIDDKVYCESGDSTSLLVNKKTPTAVEVRNYGQTTLDGGMVCDIVVAHYDDRDKTATIRIVIG